MVLARPHLIQNIQGNGNCLFHSFSNLIAGNERHHHRVQLAIVEHIRNIEPFIISNSYTSVYSHQTLMNKRGVWGTDIEIYTLPHLLINSGDSLCR